MIDGNCWNGARDGCVGSKRCCGSGTEGMEGGREMVVVGSLCQILHTHTPALHPPPSPDPHPPCALRHRPGPPPGESAGSPRTTAGAGAEEDGGASVQGCGVLQGAGAADSGWCVTGHGHHHNHRHPPPATTPPTQCAATTSSPRESGAGTYSASGHELTHIYYVWYVNTFYFTSLYTRLPKQFPMLADESIY